jgi:hypothetical protein
LGTAEELIHRRNRAGRLIEGDAFDPRHRKKQRRHADAFGVGLVDLADEMIERIQVDATERDARRVDRQQFTPDLLLGRVQTDDDDRVWFHDYSGISQDQSTAFHGTNGYGMQGRVERVDSVAIGQCTRPLHGGSGYDPGSGSR